MTDELGRPDEEMLLAAQPRVRHGQILVAHADALVHDRDEVLEADPPPVDLDVEFGRRERQAVLHQFGDDVGDVRDRRARQVPAVDAAQLDAAVLLNLADRRPDDVDECHRLGVAARAGLAGEYQQALGVAPHPGREVVELEQVRQGRGVAFLAFQLADEAELAADQVLVAPAEVGQRLRGVAPDDGLLDSQPVRCLLQVVQRPGYLDDLRAGLGGYPDRLQWRMVLDRAVDARHRLRQAPYGNVVGLVRQHGQRIGDRSRRGDEHDRLGHDHQQDHKGQCQQDTELDLLPVPQCRHPRQCVAAE